MAAIAAITNRGTLASALNTKITIIAIAAAIRMRVLVTYFIATESVPLTLETFQRPFRKGVFSFSSRGLMGRHARCAVSAGVVRRMERGRRKNEAHIRLARFRDGHPVPSATTVADLVAEIVNIGQRPLYMREVAISIPCPLVAGGEEVYFAAAEPKKAHG